MSDIKINTGDKAVMPSAPEYPIVIILDHLRSAHNVGNIFRLAELTHIQKVVCCGYTAVPPHPKLQKTAMGCDEQVAYEHFDNTIDAVKTYRNNGYHIMAVETVEDAPLHWDADYTFPLALVFGNEALGIKADVLQECDAFVQLPVYGTKNSLNVANSAAVILYKCLELLEQQRK